MTPFSILVAMSPRRVGAHPGFLPRPPVALLRLSCLLFLSAAAPVLSTVPAAAQVVQPLRGFVVDAHGAVALFDQPGQVTGPLGISKDSLPPRGLGAAAGAHVYPARLGHIVLGLGVSGLWTRGTATPVDREGRPTGPTGETSLLALVPHVSLNFGSHEGWSYISAGVGAAVYRSRLQADAVPPTPPRVRTIAFGAGARWFARPHLAFSFDLRWLALGPQPETADTPARPKTTRFVASAGVSIR